jgi:hypothetical protein
MGREMGGKARAASLSAERRMEISKKATAALKEGSLMVTHGSENSFLKIGNMKIACYVLSDGKRVLLQGPMGSALGLSDTGGQRITQLLNTKLLSGFINDDLINKIENPLRFKTGPKKVAQGYEATILVDICEAVIDSSKGKSLIKSQKALVNQCEILMRSFARVGIIALVDEATGYERDKTKNNLAQILQAFIAKELQPYVKTFPSDFYEQLFRLRGLEYPPKIAHLKPQYFGVLTNDIIYGRLAPGLLDEIKIQSKKYDKVTHFHRNLTQDKGHPKLRERLASVIAIMKLSKNYSDFISNLNNIHPRYTEKGLENLDEIDR